MQLLLALVLSHVSYRHAITTNADGLRTAKVLAGNKVVWQKAYPDAWVIGGASKDGKSFAFYDGSWRMTIWQAPGKVVSFAASPYPKDPIWADACCEHEIHWSPDKKRIFGIFGSSGGLARGLGTLVVFRPADRKAYHVVTADYVKRAQWTGNRTLKIWQEEFGVGERGKVYKPVVVRVR